LPLPSRCSRASPSAGNFPVHRTGSHSFNQDLADGSCAACAGLPRRRTPHSVRSRESIAVSKRTRERDAASHSFDPEFERALEETEHRSRDRGRRIEQKTRQLCQQARRALNLALAGHFASGALDDVFVVEVSAVGGCGRLVAHVAVPVCGSVRDVLNELRERAPQLRAAVASYISRKRAPELSFIVAAPRDESHE